MVDLERRLQAVLGDRSRRLNTVPALLISTSIRSSRSSRSRARIAYGVERLRSRLLNVSTSAAPAARTASAASASRTSSRPTRTRWCPSAPSWSADSSPIPAEAPVTTMVLTGAKVITGRKLRKLDRRPSRSAPSTSGERLCGQGLLSRGEPQTAVENARDPLPTERSNAWPCGAPRPAVGVLEHFAAAAGPRHVSAAPGPGTSRRRSRPGGRGPSRPASRASRRARRRTRRTPPPCPRARRSRRPPHARPPCPARRPPRAARGARQRAEAATSGSRGSPPLVSTTAAVSSESWVHERRLKLSEPVVAQTSSITHTLACT